MNSPQQIKEDLAMIRSRNGNHAATVGNADPIREYCEIVRNLDPDDLAAIESLNGPSAQLMQKPKIALAREKWLALSRDQRLAVCYSLDS